MVMLKCPACGAPLKIDEDSKIAFCPHCGMKQSIRLDPRKVIIKTVASEISRNNHVRQTWKTRSNHYAQGE